MENTTLNIESRVYRLIGLTPLLGGSPASRAVRTQFIASKAPSQELMEEESAGGVDLEEQGVTVFTRDSQDHLCVMGYHLKGFFKEAIKATGAQLEVAAVKGKVDTLVFVEPRYIPLCRNGQPLREEDDMLERPLRAETMRGPRTALQSSEMINDPWEITVEISLVPNKGTGKSKAVTWDTIETALQYGAFHGLGQWRNAGYGQFRFERLPDQE